MASLNEIDICIVAGRRPELLARTLESFNRNIFNLNFGDAGTREGAQNTDEAAVGEAGQIRKKQSPVDLLH